MTFVPHEPGQPGGPPVRSQPRLAVVPAWLVACALLAALALSAGSAVPRTPASGFTETLVATGLRNPTAMAFAPDGRLFVCEQGGRLRVVQERRRCCRRRSSTLTVDPIGERGLLGVAFDPGFAGEPLRLRLLHGADAAPIHNRVSRFTANGDVAVAGSEQVAPRPRQPRARDQPQRRRHPLRRRRQALRRRRRERQRRRTRRRWPTCSARSCASTPTAPSPPTTRSSRTAHRRTTARSGRSACATRSPSRSSPARARMFINDVGQNTWEEIDDGVAGANYGWPTTEGPTTDARFRSPLFAYLHGYGTTAALRDHRRRLLQPATRSSSPATYVGNYFFADYCSGWIRALDPRPAAVDRLRDGPPSRSTSRSAPTAASTTSTRGSGRRASRLRLRPHEAPPITPAAAEPDGRRGPAGDVQRVGAPGTPPLSYQWQRNGANIAGATGDATRSLRGRAPDNGARFRAVVIQRLRHARPAATPS